MFEARGVRFEDIPREEEVPLSEGTGAGRGFAVTGGVAGAVVDVIHRMDPDREVKVASAEGLDNCKKMLLLAKAGKYSREADKQNAMDSDYELDLPLLK